MAIVLDIGVPISTSEQRGSLFRSTMWFEMGYIWGLICQLAMAGVTLISLNYDLGSSKWFEWTTVLLFSLLHISGVFALRSTVHQLVQLVRRSDTESNINTSVVTKYLDHLTKSFLLGSLVSPN